MQPAGKVVKVNLPHTASEAPRLFGRGKASALMFRKFFAPFFIIGAASFATTAEARVRDKSWLPVSRGDLCVTTGVIEPTPNGLAIEAPEVRATLRIATVPAAELRFIYLGPTIETAPLASGEVRRQIGIKLRAQDGCNVLYVMWHIAPDTKIAILVKRNPGMHSNTECGNGGYLRLKAPPQVQVPIIEPGVTHSLRAALRSNRLEVFADGIRVFRSKPLQALAGFDGPSGLRTDNARVRFQFLAGRGGFGPSGPPLDLHSNHCR
jgi:hypothetical protein